MVCYALTETPQCQCVVRSSGGDTVYEVTLPAVTPASSLVHEVAKKLDKQPNQILLLFQNTSNNVEVTVSTTGSLEDVGLKASHSVNFLVVLSNQPGDTRPFEEADPIRGIRFVCFDSTETARCQCIVRNSKAHKVYEVTHPASTPASTLVFEVALKLDKQPHQISLLYQSVDKSDFMITVNTTVSLEGVGLKMSPNRNLLIVEETGNKSSDPEPVDEGEHKSADIDISVKLSQSEDRRRRNDKPRRRNDLTSLIAPLPLPSTSLLSTPNYVGLVNQAMTCYLNSLLQALYMTPEFRNALYKWEFDGKNPTKSIPFQLQKLFLNLQTSARCAVETTELTLSFGWGTGDVWHQHDVQELCRVMFDALEQEFKNTSQADLINHLYQGKMIDYVMCLECGREKSREDTFLDIPLPVRPYGSTIAYASIEEAMRAFVTPETLDGTNQYNCENCNKKCNAHKGLKFSKFPYLLTLHLKRFDFDYSTMHRIKLNDKVVFPEILELDSFLLNSPSMGSSVETKCDDGSTADSALGDEAASSAALSVGQIPDLISPPADHDLIEDEGIEVSQGGGSASSSSSGSYSGSESCDAQAPTTDLQNAVSNTSPDAGAASDQTVPQAPSTESNSEGAEAASSVFLVANQPAEFRYELYSIMIHSGSASGGHYYAYIKDFTTDHWFCFNDQSVTKVTVEDIEKSYGGGPTRGYYSGVFSSSTNAYMLMYRFIDSERNTLPMTPEEFPSHIKTLVEEMVAGEERERRMKARDEETVKVKVCYQSNQTKVFVHRDDPFSDALRHAYDNLQLEGLVARSDCRLVSYGISRNSKDCSLEDRDSDTMGNVLAYLKSNNCSTDFLLEAKHPNFPFPIYRPDDIRIDVCRVNVSKEEVLGVQQVQVPVGVKVSGLKHHLRLSLPDLLPPPPADLVLVVYHSSRSLPAFQHLSDDEQLLSQILESATYFKIFATPLTPSLQSDLESGFRQSNFYKFLRKVENVVILHISLPEVNDDALERFLIPPLSEQKTSENNNKQDLMSGEGCSGNGSSNIGGLEEENMAGGVVTTSDQSTSEDSSLTDSERTIIGEPPQMEGQLSSPSDSDHQLSSPETNMAVEMNGDVDVDMDDLDNRTRSNKDLYIKITPYNQSSQKMVKIVVDRSAEWSVVEKCLEPCCGVSRQYLLVTTGSGDIARPSETIKSIFNLKHYDSLSVRLHRPLAHNEYKNKLYRFLPDSPQPFQYLCDWIVVRGQNVGENKKSLVKYIDRRNFLHVSLNRCRLRRKNWKSVGRPWLDTESWEEPTRHPEELLLEELVSDEAVLSPSHVPIFLRKVFPSKLTFSPFHEIVVDVSQPFNIFKQISELSEIPEEHLKLARSSTNFPWDTSAYLALQDLDWNKDTTLLCSPNFTLEADDPTSIILYRDERDDKNKLEMIPTEWIQGLDALKKEMGTTGEGGGVIAEDRRYTPKFSAREERLSSQSPRKEKPLKIYLHNKNDNCYVPPPDYD